MSKPRYIRRNNKQIKLQTDKENVNLSLNTSNPIMLAFKTYSLELDEKHDRYERILKCGRDVTTESKRIISLLHTIDYRKMNKEDVLSQAKTRLAILCEVNFLNIATEIGHLDPYQYLKAYSPGIQEFIEALTYYEYLSDEPLSNWVEIQNRLSYEPKESEIITKENSETDVLSINPKCEIQENEVSKLSCLVEPTEYFLGLSDLTGELLRRCIISLGSGDVASCFNCCSELKLFYKFYVSINNCNRYRELSRKIFTMGQSLLKCETVCYNVKVRGREAAKWGSSGNDNYHQEIHGEEDEGYY